MSAQHKPSSTARLQFRLWEAGDAEQAWALWGDPEVTRWIGGPFTRGEVEARLARERARQDTLGVQYWPVVRRDDGAWVGCCGLVERDVSAGGFELGFHVHTAFWGQGYAREAAEAVIGFAFEEREVPWLFAGHHPANSGSRRLLERLGFRYTHHERYPLTGLEHPSYRLEAPGA